MTLPSDPSPIPNFPPQSNSSSNTWDPPTISNIVFSAIMVFIGIIAIWQAHSYHHRPQGALDLDEEEIIGIRILSRASTASSGNPLSLDSALPSSQLALATPSNEDQENIGTLATADRADRLDDTPVGAVSCL